MHNKPLERRTRQEIEAAIGRAKDYAQEQDVPLTAERLAAELDMDLPLFQAIAAGELACSGKKTREKVAIIQRACGEATASVVEHAMRRGSGTNMHMLYLKNNAGYDKPKTEKTTKNADDALPPVIFIGEESLTD